MRNKKGIGTASSFLIVLVIGLSLIMWFSSLVSNLVVHNGVTDIEEFKDFETIYNDTIDDSNTIANSLESEEEGIKAKQGERFEDSIFRRVFKTIKLTLKSSSIMSKSLSTTLEGGILTIPDVVKNSILIILGLILAFLVVKAWWRFRDV